jgi:hypothetical protein
LPRTPFGVARFPEKEEGSTTFTVDRRVSAAIRTPLFIARIAAREVFTYLSLVTLPPAFAALTAFAAVGRLPSLLAPIARLAPPVHGIVQPRGVPDGLPAGRTAVTTLLYHGLVVARTAPPEVAPAEAPAPELAAPASPGHAGNPRAGAGRHAPSAPPWSAPREPGGSARPPALSPTASPTAPGTLTYETPALTEAAPHVVFTPPVESAVASVPPVEQDAGGSAALGQLPYVAGVGRNSLGIDLGRTVGPAAAHADDLPTGWTDHVEPARGDEAAGKGDGRGNADARDNGSSDALGTAENADGSTRDRATDEADVHADAGRVSSGDPRGDENSSIAANDGEADGDGAKAVTDADPNTETVSASNSNANNADSANSTDTAREDSRGHTTPPATKTKP